MVIGMLAGVAEADPGSAANASDEGDAVRSEVPPTEAVTFTVVDVAVLPDTPTVNDALKVPAVSPVPDAFTWTVKGVGEPGTTLTVPLGVTVSHEGEPAVLTEIVVAVLDVTLTVCVLVPPD
jgi:hypothetical protein